MKVAVSFLKSIYDTSKTIEEINNTDADYIHVDIMDGKFVENTTIQYNDLKGILNNSRIELDVHLMVENPIDYILDFKNLNPKYITIHREISKNIDNLIDLIHSFKIGAGISINPNTKVSSIEKYLGKVDNVLIMSVEPGKGGQKFNDQVLPKIYELIKLREKNNYKYVISIDGGINNTTINRVKDVDFIISGSYICMSDNYQEKINELR